MEVLFRYILKVGNVVRRYSRDCDRGKLLNIFLWASEFEYFYLIACTNDGAGLICGWPPCTSSLQHRVSLSKDIHKNFIIIAFGDIRSWFKPKE